MDMSLSRVVEKWQKLIVINIIVVKNPHNVLFLFHRWSAQRWETDMVDVYVVIPWCTVVWHNFTCSLVWHTYCTVNTTFCTSIQICGIGQLPAALNYIHYTREWYISAWINSHWASAWINNLFLFVNPPAPIYHTDTCNAESSTGWSTIINNLWQ